MTLGTVPGCAVDGQGGSGGGGGGVGCDCQRLLVCPTDLSSCEVSGSLADWRTPMEIAMADSTNDLYQLQVSPPGSSSEGWCRFLPTWVFRCLLVLALLGQVGSKGEGVPGVWGEKAVL